jgi:hypothetical protein
LFEHDLFGNALGNKDLKSREGALKKGFLPPS